VGVGNLDATVERLLEEPIRFAGPFIIKDMDKAGAGKVNGELRTFCSSQRNTLRKYPFQSSSADDASLEEFAGIFHPATGAIWQFQQKSLAELTVKEGSIWKAKDPAKKPQVTPELLAFLNRAQSIADAFYPGGATQAQLTYTLRPKLDSSLKEFTLELEIDGRPYQWTSGLQHAFNWPPPSGAKNPGAVARLRSTASNFAVAFASRGGIWGVFRVFGDAEPRELGAKLVEWKYTSSGVGRREPIQPAPVQLEIVGFPGGQDVFNPKFWTGLRCPSMAVQ
jgi:type VI protein secretion system component VasK